VDERAAFESKIDENPLDATTHLVYADWLDDHGEGDEAAFRRSMGNWMQEHGKKLGENTRHTAIMTFDPPWRINRDTIGYPEGIKHHQISYKPRAINPENPHWNSYTYGWKKYRHMEEALRRAFMAGRQTTPERLSRWFLARRDARRRYGG
jgi:uncharacterized protein (TIGR02996 family)